MSEPIETERTQLRRHPERGSRERDLIHQILDEGLVCHLGFVDRGQPFVLPTAYVRVGEFVYLHAAAKGRFLNAVAGGEPVCLTVTLLDGLVLARSAFHHSMNFRSVVMLGSAETVTDEREKRVALEALVEHVVPGRMADARPPADGEIAATIVVKLLIAESSAKVRFGPPIDSGADRGRPCWAGVIPLRLTPGEPVTDPGPGPGVSIPSYVIGWRT